MNRIWVSIILISFIYGICTNRIEVMVSSMYTVLDDSIKVILKIASVMLIWNAIFAVLNKCNVLDKIAKPFRIFIKPLNLNESEEVLNNLSISFSINSLGLGMASVPFMVNVLKRCRKENISKILLFNLCPITLFPSTILALRNEKSFGVWLAITGVTIIMYLITILYIRIIKPNE